MPLGAMGDAYRGSTTCIIKTSKNVLLMYAKRHSNVSAQTL